MRPFLAALFVVLTACSSAPETPDPSDARDAEIQALRDLEAAHSAAWAKRDADKIASFYASDAFLQLAHRPVINQMGAIRREIDTMVADPNLSLTWTPDSIEVSRSLDLAWSHGSFSITYTDPASKKPVVESGHYVTTFRKVNDGTWRVVADVPTSSAPPTPKP